MIFSPQKWPFSLNLLTISPKYVDLRTFVVKISRVAYALLSSSPQVCQDWVGGGIELNPDNASISLLLVKLIFIWVKNLTFRNSQLHLATILGTKTVKVPRRDPFMTPKVYTYDLKCNSGRFFLCILLYKKWERWSNDFLHKNYWYLQCPLWFCQRVFTFPLVLSVYW